MINLQRARRHESKSAALYWEEWHFVRCRVVVLAILAVSVPQV